MNEEEIKLLDKLEDKKHKNKMEELTRELENARIFHDLELQRIRIKSAEIRRSRSFK